MTRPFPAAAIRGGNWDNGTDAGAFALNLNNAPSNASTNIGARCCAGMLAGFCAGTRGLPGPRAVRGAPQARLPVRAGGPKSTRPGGGS